MVPLAAFRPERQPFRILVLVDDGTRECLARVVDTSLSGRRFARERDRIIAGRGTPQPNGFGDA